MARVAGVARGVLASRVWGIGVLAGLLAGFVPASAQAMSASAYVTNVNGHNVFQFGLGPGGLLSAPVPATVEAGTRPLGVASSPDGKSAYVANGGGESVSQYDVGAGGLLSAKTPATVPAGKEPESVAVSPDGKSVYVTNHQGESISQYDLGPGGLLSAKAPATVPTTGSTPGGIAVSPDGRSAYVADSKGFVLQFGIGAGGLLSALAPAKVAAGTAPIAVAVSPDGHSVYVANFTGGEGPGSVSQYDVGPGGLLLAKTPAAVPAALRPQRVAVSPDGGSVYVTGGEINGSVSQYDVGAGGALSAKTPATVKAGAEPVGIALSPDGHSAYTADLHGYVAQFDVGAGGALSAKTPPTVLAGTGPPAEPDGIALLPDQGPLAAFAATPAPAGSPSVFDGSASSDPDGAVARYDWSFGDGTSAPNAGARPAHTYGAAGSYTVTLRVTDDAGCSTQLIFTGQTAYCNGSTAASTTRTLTVAAPVKTQVATTLTPTVNSLSETAKTWREGSGLAHISANKKSKKKKLPVGTTFSFSLNEPASVRFTFSEPAGGRKVGKTCVAQTRKNKKKHRCTRTVVAGTLTFPAHAGTNKVRFEGVISRHKKLRLGSYTLLVTATASGKHSTPRTLHFTIAKR